MLCILIFGFAACSLLNLRKLWFVQSSHLSLGHPWKLLQVISVLGVHRPGYLPQEGHRLTQFLDPGHTRLCISSLASIHSHSVVRDESVLRTSITRQEPGLNRIKMQLPWHRAVIARGIKTNSKWNEKKQVAVVRASRKH